MSLDVQKRKKGGRVVRLARRRLFVAIGVVGPLWPPMHLRGEGFTLTDTLHIAFTMVTGLFMLVAIGFAATAFGKRFRLYSIATIAIMVVFVILTGFSAPRIPENLPTPWIGLWERVNIGAYLLWVAVLATWLLRARGHAAPRQVGTR